MKTRLLSFLVTSLLTLGAVACADSRSCDPYGCGGSDAHGGGGGEGGGGVVVGPGQFGCGQEAACDLATEYCFTDPGDGAQPATSHCIALPAGCTSCDCLPHDGCFSGAPCTGDSSSGLQITCYGS